MRVIVIGASGFIGSHLMEALLADGALADRSGTQQRIREIVAIDIAPPSDPSIHSDSRVRSIIGDASDVAEIERAMEGGVDSIFALGATLTSDAEVNFAHGLDVNLQGMLRLLEACRRRADQPRLVFTSSIAAFGGPLPETVEDDLQLTPQTSYGTQKAVNELLINDYSRRGAIDGRSLRLPVVLVRPAAAGASISDRMAAVIREPLSGRDAICPLDGRTLIPIASARAVARALLTVHDLPAQAFGHTRSMNLPAISIRIDELVRAVETIAQRRPWHWRVGGISWQHDAAMQAIVGAWPQRFDSARTRALGVHGDATLDQIIDHFINDYLPTATTGPTTP